ncbi:MAG: toll/interleukin-1 receptor domain-containing protein [bacterium]|nr:toll/interleukin-1 receptor domain-containing protein [bacterium]
MLFNKSGFRAFNDYDLRVTLENQLNQLKSKIETDLREKPPQDKFAYISEQVSLNKIKPLELHVENLTMIPSQQMVPSEYFPSGFFVREGNEYPKEIITFHLPFTGDAELLHCVPSTRILWTEEIALSGGEIIFDLINFSNNVEDIQRKKDEVLNFLQKQTTNVNNEVNGFNDKLPNEIENIINQTEHKLSESSEFLSKLGVPLKTSQESQNITSDLSQPKSSRVNSKSTKQFDVFICHASEDKLFVDTLAKKLQGNGIDVWYDAFQLGWGDDLRSAIDNGLKNSLFGIVVFSKSLLAGKKWTEYELSGLFAREENKRKVILPIWHEITRDDIAKYSPSLADRFAKNSDSLDSIMKELKSLIKERKS